MFDILSVIPGKKKKTSSGWTTFNAVCCHHAGHKPDKRMRGGIKYDNGTNWFYHCFNCDYKCHFILGKKISYKTTKLLTWCGIDTEQIDKWSLESLQQRDFVETLVMQKRTRSKIRFKEAKLPEDAELIDKNNPKHQKFVDFLSQRSLTTDDFGFLITPNQLGRMGNRIIIPYTFKNKIVGMASRFLDSKTPKYIHEHQPGYIFGYDFQKHDWQFCIVTEGIFDALSLNCCAIMHQTISDEQANLLLSLNKRIIVVPDQDRSGLGICERALELGFQVSIPEWDQMVKDVNDAVVRYGKLATLMSIVQSATSNKIKIEMARKKIDKRIHS